MKHKQLYKKRGKTQKGSGFGFSYWKYCLSIAVIAFFSSETHAQTILNASGGSGDIAGNLYAYSIGEMVLVSTETSSSFTVTQGVLQAKSTTMGVEETSFLEDGLALYPNPVKNTLYLQPALPGGGELALWIFDLNGQLVMKEKINLQSGTERQQLNLSALQEGNYLLYANLQQEEEIYEHTFKIIKKGK